MSVKQLSLFVVSLLVPVAVQAAAISADDTVAGLGTDIDISDLAANTPVTVVITPPLGAEVIADVTADDSGTAHVQIPARETEVAGTYHITLEQAGTPLPDTARFEVLADSFHPGNSSIQPTGSYVAADGKNSVSVSVILRDQYGNPLSGRPIKLISSRSTDVVTAQNSQTDEGGEQRFSVRAVEAGTVILRAVDLISGDLLPTEAAIQAGQISGSVGGTDTVDTRERTRRFYYGIEDTSTDTRPLYNADGQQLGASLLGSNLTAQINYGLVDHFIISAPTDLKVNEDATIRITAVDRNGNKVEDYTGLVLLSSTDPQAFLPVSGRVRFRAQDLGDKQLTLGLRFINADEHILRAEDSEDSSIMGETVITVTGGRQQQVGSRLIQVSAPAAGALLNEPTVTVEGVTEPFVNLIVTGGTEEVKGDTDINGDFAIEVPLDPEKTEHTLRVTDETGQLESSDITVRLDVTPPEISAITFSPETPTEETDVLLVITTEAGITDISATLDGEEIELQKAPGAAVKYQSLLTAPAAGAHTVVVSATDAAGNTAEETATLQTALKGLPQVQNVIAQAEANAVTLQWDPITVEEVDAYRIYVGETPTEFAFSLDTSYATTAAQVAGLRPGADYFFTVTALQGERESEEPSEVVRATVLGVRLDVTPQDSALQLDWSNLLANQPLSSFILEYGVEPDSFTEQRIINGELRNYTIRDLINDITYYVRLTPVNVAGEPLEDLISDGQGTPTSLVSGFHPSASDPVPFEIGSVIQRQNTQSPPNLHEGAPQTSETGLPSAIWVLTAAVAAAILLVYWQRRKNLLAATSFLQTMDQYYRR